MKKDKRKYSTDVLFIVLGLALLLIPGATADIACAFAAAVLGIYGLINIIWYVIYDLKSRKGIEEDRIKLKPDLTKGIILLTAGVLVYFLYPYVISLVPVIFGVVIMLYGIYRLKVINGIEFLIGSVSRKSTVIAVINIILGLVIIFNAYFFAKVVMRIIGAVLIYMGISDLIIKKKIEDLNDGDDNVIDV